MVRIPLEWFEFAFKRLESLSNKPSIALNFVLMVQICIRMVRTPFQWLEFALECCESRSNGSNLHSNGSSPF